MTDKFYPNSREFPLYLSTDNPQTIDAPCAISRAVGNAARVLGVTVNYSATPPDEEIVVRMKNAAGSVVLRSHTEASAQDFGDNSIGMSFDDSWVFDKAGGLVTVDTDNTGELITSIVLLLDNERYK